MIRRVLLTDDARSIEAACVQIEEKFDGSFGVSFTLCDGRNVVRLWDSSSGKPTELALIEEKYTRLRDMVNEVLSAVQARIDVSG